jgi:hypothetical protein
VYRRQVPPADIARELLGLLPEATLP